MGGGGVLVSRPPPRGGEAAVDGAVGGVGVGIVARQVGAVVADRPELPVRETGVVAAVLLAAEVEERVGDAALLDDLGRVRGLLAVLAAPAEPQAAALAQRRLDTDG